MAEVKLTKTELRDQQSKLGQLKKYLPTLQLKKAMLQLEVSKVHQEITELEKYYHDMESEVKNFTALFTEANATDLFQNIEIQEVRAHYENIAGVEINVLEEVVFNESHYSLYVLPAWVDTGIKVVRELITVREKLHFAVEKKIALQKELTEVSIRVNLFEKVLIPRAKKQIKRIKIFLGDAELAAVAQAKVAKLKILKGKEEARA